MSIDLEDKPKEIYDDDKPSWKTNLEDISELEDSFSKSSATDEDLPPGHPSRTKSKDGLSSKDVKDKEESAGKDTLGKGYTPEDGSSSNLTKMLANKKKQLAIGGGIMGIIGVAGISIFMLILPLKIVHVVNNIQDRFFGNSETAVEGRVEYYFNRYLTDHVFKSLRGTGVCKSTKTIDRSCISPVTGSGPVATLYRGWQDERLETKMATRYGFEISKEAGSNNYIFKVDGKVAEVSNIDIEGFRKNPANGLFQASGGRSDIRRSVKQALEGETRWKKVMYRYKVGRLMERKYGIRRCVFFCNTRDKLADWKDNKKNAYKATLARRVLENRSETLGLAMGCIFSTSCDNDPVGTDGNDDNDLEKKDKLQRNIEKYLSERGAEYTSDSVAKLTETVSNISEAGGFSKYVIQTVVTKVAGETAGKVVTKGIPIVGWIDMVAQFTSKIKSAGPKYKKWAFAVNSAGMVAQYTLYRSHADEIKGGKVDAELMGTVADSLNGMEQSPLYTDVMGTGSSAPTSLLFPSAFAQSTETPTGYKCDDGKPVPEGKKVCTEESLDFSNFLTSASDLFKIPGLEQFGAAADAWNASVGKAFNAVGTGISWLTQQIPGADALNDKIAELTQPLLEQAGKIIPNPFSDNMSGGRSFNVAAGGADVSAYHYGEFGIGGRKLSNQEVAEVRNARKADAIETFKEKPLYARLFDKEDSKSLLSQVAISTPSNVQSFGQSGFAALTANPIGKIMGSFGTLFSTRTTFAETAEEDPFGVPQMGIPLNDPAITAETPEDCNAYNKEWAEDTKLDEASGQEIHDRINVCLLDQVAIGSGGGYFTSDVLTPEDLGNKSNSGAPTSGTNASLYFIGDSLTVGMKAAGLDAKLQEKGWSPTSSGLVSRKISGGVQPDGVTQLNNDRAIASTAGTIVIALGTNNFGDSPEKFNTELQKMYDQVKSINSTASIVWVNVAGSGTFSAPLQQKSALIAQFAQKNNIKVVDWASQASKYITGNDVHPARNYPQMTDFVVTSIGQAPAASSGIAQPAGGPITIDKTSEIPGSGGIRIETSTLPQFMRMIDDAKKAGINLYPISSGWRDPQNQIALRKQNCPDWQNSPSSACRPPTAKPGSSMHERGQAIDFGNMCYPSGKTCPGNPRWEWLRANAGKYGFLPLSREAWHWSLTGR